jgi:hypothetical protein
MSGPRPYRGEVFAIATMHAKERAVAKPFRRWLGADVVALPGVDTDAFGTFTGEIARQGTMLDAARAKAQAAVDVSGLSLGIGSEGSFGPHPLVPFIPAAREVVLVNDRKHGIEIHEALVTHRTNFASRTCRPGDDIDEFLLSVGFPAHAVVVSPNEGCAGPDIVKGISTLPSLLNVIGKASRASGDDLALVVTDMRAHVNPTRMAVIRALSSRLARRLATPCPRCGVPGFGRVDLIRGLPCGYCGEPTRLPLAELWCCTKCGFEVSRSLRKGPDTADPGQCANCNP